MITQKTAIASSKPIIALTFDDGPNTSTTLEVLEILKKYNIPASFFVVGNNINDETTAVIRKAFEMGCEIDNHSQTHSNMKELSPNDILTEIKYTSDKVEKIIGVPTKFFRPPYIAVNQTMFDTINLPFINGYGANDWEDSVDAKTRYKGIAEKAKDGGIILLHDAAGNHQTVEAIDMIIPELLKQGYQFVTVSQLFEIKGIEPVESYIYTNVLQTEAWG